MKTPMLKICIPLALAFAAGCATQSADQGAASTSGDQSGTSSTATSRGTGSGSMSSGSMSGSQGSRAMAGEPGKHSVFFEFDRANLSPDDRALVEAHAQYLKEHPDIKVRVEGNTDERGSKEYNLALGQRRAESVTRVMKLLGVKEQRLEAVSYGEEKPRAPGHDEQAWAQNRRSDISY